MLVQLSSSDANRGRIMGIWMIVYSGSVPLGSLWAGEVALGCGVTLVMEVSAALCVAVAIGVLATGVLIPKHASSP